MSRQYIDQPVKGYHGRKRIYNPDKAGYVFSLEEIDPKTGLYDMRGIVSDEEVVGNFLSDDGVVKRIQVFTLGQIEGPVRIINSLEEFMEFQ